MHHLRVSATAVKILGDKLRSNGNVASMKHWPCHDTPRRGQLSWCKGTSQYADFISILANREPGPKLAATLAIRFMEIYWSKQRLEFMPSLTLLSSGDERSVIRRHFPGV